MDQEEEDTIEQTADDLFLTAVLFESALGLLALFLGWILGPDARAMIPEAEWGGIRAILSGLAYGCAAAIPLVILIELLRKVPWEPVRQLERLGDDGMIKTLLSLGSGELLVISLCAGVGEELLFRGWLLPWLAGGGVLNVEPSQVEWGFALVASSLAFGLVHPITRLYVVLAALMGLYFGVLLLWTENLLIPIMAHATYDAFQLLMPKFKKPVQDVAAEQ
ncbi:CPBP family intramembrane glutamic endopeptidase [Novipirellula artificiosorum]|uniref:CAAX amino terminal protease self-immunity n=1 Tax=Novipirellula artificiosorum TaxID=2528016 RepID=A0A5C6DQF1_9BACT|nr:CPBP family intramembrane glutamic endopeptidase [Novipirellula artificiosorum]TWU38455.1 CAAX amino terminal protease self- immunity [Novipirellula artificiosorum]